MLVMIRPLLKTVVHIMANVDQSSSVLLNVNEDVVNFAVNHDIPSLAQLSLKTVQTLDHFVSNLDQT